MNIWEPTGPKSLIWQRIGYVVADLEQADLWATTCHCVCGQDNQFPDNGRIDFNLLEVITNTLQVNTVCITSEWLIARYGKKCTAWSYAAKKKMNSKHNWFVIQFSDIFVFSGHFIMTRSICMNVHLWKQLMKQIFLNSIWEKVKKCSSIMQTCL